MERTLGPGELGVFDAMEEGNTNSIAQPLPISLAPDCHFRAEVKLLTDILVSVPKIKQEKVRTFV